MKSPTRLALLALAVTLATGCATAKYMEAAKNTRPKNPHAALEYLALVLKEDAANQEAIDLANEIGKEIASQADAKVRDHDRAKKYAEAVAVCDRVIATRDFLKKIPGNIDIFVNEEERPKYAQKAAEDYYAQGDSIAAGPTTTATAMKAAMAFRRANGFVPGFKDAEARYRKQRSAGTTRVAFGPFKCTQGTDFLVPRFQGQLKEVITTMGAEFLEITGKRDANTTAVLTATIEGGFRDSKWKKDNRKNEVTKSREVGTDEQGNTVYEDYVIKATWTVYTRTTNAKLTLRYQIRDLKGGQLDAGSGNMKLSDTKRYVGNFGGDTSSDEYEDALPYEIQQMTRQKTEPANFRQLADAMSEKWAMKGAPIYKFGHKIFNKFSGHEGQ